MTFECGACGESFEDRLEHVPTCQGPFPTDWWDESDGDVLWWCWRDGDWLAEPPYVGTPLCCGYTIELHARDREHKVSRMDVGGWPGYHTHWTRLPPRPDKPNNL